MKTVLLFLIAPLAFFVLIWGGVMVCRLFAIRVFRNGSPEFAARPFRYAVPKPRQEPVGVREIHDEQRYRRYKATRVLYDYHDGYSGGIPRIWLEDVWERRN